MLYCCVDIILLGTVLDSPRRSIARSLLSPSADLHAVPLLNLVTQGAVDEALLGEQAEALEARRGNVDGVHGAAAARDVADEDRGGGVEGVVGGEGGGDGGLGGGHGGGFVGGGGGGVEASREE